MHSQALTAPDLLKRIRKHGTRDLDCMHERESFVRAWKENLTNCLEMDISPLEQLHWVVRSGPPCGETSVSPQANAPEGLIGLLKSSGAHVF